MSRRRVRIVFTVALAISVLTHLMLLALVDAAIRRSQQRAWLAMTNSQPMIVPVEMELGIETPMPPSVAWLASETPQKQFAPPGQLDQAAFTQEQTPGGMPTPDRAPTATPDHLAPAISADIQQAAGDVLRKLVKESQRLLTEKDDGPAEAHSEPALAQGPPSHESAPSLLLSKARTASGESSQSPAPPPSHAPVEAAAPADKESDAASIIDIPPDQWKLGKPLAGQGLELKPRRPTLTVLTMLTAAPGNPLCRLEFGRDGAPKSARIIESSGDQRVDDAILASLYRWRAAGQELEQLDEDETLRVQIRMLLTRRRMG
jgi:hypothetical protein